MDCDTFCSQYTYLFYCRGDGLVIVWLLQVCGSSEGMVLTLTAGYVSDLFSGRTCLSYRTFHVWGTLFHLALVVYGDNGWTLFQTLSGDTVSPKILWRHQHWFDRDDLGSIRFVIGAFGIHRHRRSDSFVVELSHVSTDGHYRYQSVGGGHRYKLLPPLAPGQPAKARCNRLCHATRRIVPMDCLPPLLGLDYLMDRLCTFVPSYHSLRHHRHHDSLPDGPLPPNRQMVSRTPRKCTSQLETSVSFSLLTSSLLKSRVTSRESEQPVSKYQDS